MILDNMKKALLGAVVGAGAVAGAVVPSSAGEFDGVTVNILTRPGYVIAGRLAERGLEFQEQTGIPMADLIIKPLPIGGWEQCSESEDFYRRVMDDG